MDWLSAIRDIIGSAVPFLDRLTGMRIIGFNAVLAIIGITIMAIIAVVFY